MSKVEEERHLRNVHHKRAMSAAVASAFLAIGDTPQHKHYLLQTITSDLVWAIFDRGYTFGYEDGAEAQSELADKGGASL